MTAAARTPRARAGWLAAATFVLATVLPPLAQATSGKELVAIFRAHCVEPFPSVDEIADAARGAGLEEHPLTIDEVLGSNVLSPAPEADPASVMGFDARVFLPLPPAMGPGASLIAAPVITAIFMERRADGLGNVTATACSVSATKASEGRAGLQAGAIGVTRALEDRFGYPFFWTNQAMRETGEFVTGEMAWRPAGQPQPGGGQPEISASLQYIETEPRRDIAGGSFWLLALRLAEVRS